MTPRHRPGDADLGEEMRSRQAETGPSTPGILCLVDGAQTRAPNTVPKSGIDTSGYGRRLGVVSESQACGQTPDLAPLRRLTGLWALRHQLPSAGSADAAPAQGPRRPLAFPTRPLSLLFCYHDILPQANPTPLCFPNFFQSTAPLTTAARQPAASPATRVSRLAVPERCRQSANPRPEPGPH